MVVAALAWLMFEFAGRRTGMAMLPDDRGSTVELLDDASGRLSLAEAIARPAAEWVGSTERKYLLAPHGHALWLRVILRNPGPTPLHGVLADLQYYPDRVTAWRRDPAGVWQAQESGELLPTRARALWARAAAFRVEVPAGGEETVYLRGEDYYFVYMQLRWWPRLEDFVAAQVREVLAESLCYGALAGLLLYNLVLWARLRFPDTGCYVLYAGGLAVFNLATNACGGLLGFGFGSPAMESVLVGSLAWSGFFLVQFARTFLDTPAVVPRGDRGLRIIRAGLAVIALGALVMPWFGRLNWLAAAVALVTVTHATLLGVAVVVWRAGRQQARFFIPAFGVLFVGGVPATVTWFGHSLNANAAMGLLAASTLEMLLLSFAIADRFAQIQRERLHAQQQVVEEAEQRRAIQEAYADELQLEVMERTRELAAANIDKDRMIAVLGHDLRGPLTGLTQSAERLAGRVPPGGEMARFVGDVGVTGRELLLLIEDLVMWARLRAGSLHVTRHAVADWVRPAMAVHRALAERSGITLRAHVPPELQVETDLVLVQALVRNLVSNAVKYARNHVVILVEATADGLQLSVGDDGPGLPAEVDAWLNAEVVAPSPTGSGLGLRFCVEISRTLGARLKSTKGPGGGTRLTVAFKLPVQEAQVT